MFAPKVNKEDYRFSKLKGKTVMKKPGDVKGLQFVMEELEDCTAQVLDHSTDVYIDVCKNSKIVMGPVEGSLFIRDCENCEFTVACQQFRTRNCKNCTFNLYVETQPIIESSTKMNFACWNLAYPQLEEQFKAAKMDPKNNMWDKIYDFTENDATVPQPHWFIGTQEFAMRSIEVEGMGDPQNPVLLPNGSEWTPAAAEAADNAGGETPSSKKKKKKKKKKKGGAGGEAAGENGEEEENDDAGSTKAPGSPAPQTAPAPASPAPATPAPAAAASGGIDTGSAAHTKVLEDELQELKTKLVMQKRELTKQIRSAEDEAKAAKEELAKAMAAKSGGAAPPAGPVGPTTGMPGSDKDHGTVLMDEITDLKTKLVKQKREMTSKLREAEQEIEKLKSTAGAASASGAQEELAQQLARSQAECTTLRSGNAELEKKVLAMKKEEEHLKSKVSALEQQVDKLSSQPRSRETTPPPAASPSLEAKNAQEELAKEKLKNAQLQSTIDQLNATINKVEAARPDTDDEISKLSAQIDKLKVALVQAEENARANASRANDVTSAAAEARMESVAPTSDADSFTVSQKSTPEYVYGLERQIALLQEGIETARADRDRIRDQSEEKVARLKAAVQDEKHWIGTHLNNIQKIAEYIKSDEGQRKGFFNSLAALDKELAHMVLHNAAPLTPSAGGIWENLKPSSTPSNAPLQAAASRRTPSPNRGSPANSGRRARSKSPAGPMRPQTASLTRSVASPVTPQQQPHGQQEQRPNTSAGRIASGPTAARSPIIKGGRTPSPGGRGTANNTSTTSSSSPAATGRCSICHAVTTADRDVCIGCRSAAIARESPRNSSPAPQRRPQSPFAPRAVSPARGAPGFGSSSARFQSVSNLPAHQADPSFKVQQEQYQATVKQAWGTDGSGGQ